MSFLFQPTVFQSLVNSLYKQGQAADPTPISTSMEGADPNAVAKKLVNTLSSQIDPGQASANISSAGIANLTATDLTNLDKLLDFLARNQVALDGKRIAYQLNEDIPDTIKGQLYQTSRYFDLPALVKYVQYLQKKAEGNHLMQVLVGGIVDDVNGVEKNSGLTRAPASQPGQPNQMPDTTVVDYFGSKIFDQNQPNTDRGTIPLTAKDLQNKENFNSWLQMSPTANLVMNKQEVPYTDDHADLCIIFHVLYRRAQKAVQYSQSAQASKAAAFYLKQIQQLAAEYSGADGKPCSISGGTSEPASPTGVNVPGSSKPGEDKTHTARTFDPLIQSLPLRLEDINFTRIEDFFGYYHNIIGEARGGAVVNAINMAMTGMRSIQTDFLVNNSQNIFNLSSSAAEVKMWVKPPEGNVNFYFAFINKLKQVLYNTNYVLSDLRDAYGDRLDDRQKNYLLAQVGSGPGTSSIYNNNWNQLTRLEIQGHNA